MTSRSARYPLPEGQAGILRWARWVYVAMSALAVVGLQASLSWGDPSGRTLWSNGVGVIMFPVLAHLSFRQLHHHQAALRPQREGRPTS